MRTLSKVFPIGLMAFVMALCLVPTMALADEADGEAAEGAIAETNQPAVQMLVASGDGATMEVEV